MASEMIEVYYQSLECISDICYYHTFFVYTYKNGNKEALRGGPSYGYNLLEYNKEFTIGKYDKSFVEHPEYDEKQFFNLWF